MREKRGVTIEVESCGTGHWPFLSMLEKVVEAINRAAGAS
jgi:hypothetical protein